MGLPWYGTWVNEHPQMPRCNIEPETTTKKHLVGVHQLRESQA